MSYPLEGYQNNKQAKIKSVNLKSPIYINGGLANYYKHLQHATKFVNITICMVII
jgi:hypothetical protein